MRNKKTTRRTLDRRRKRRWEREGWRLEEKVGGLRRRLELAEGELPIVNEGIWQVYLYGVKVGLVGDLLDDGVREC